MEYIIKTINANTFRLTIGLSSYDLDLQVTKITPTTYVEETQTLSIDPDVSPTAGVYTLSGSADDEWNISLSSDGVYKIYVTESGTQHVHIFINTNTLDVYLKSILPNIVCCNPVDKCHCGTMCDDYYDFNILALLSLSCFGVDNIDIQFDYRTFSGEYLYRDYRYECKSAGSGPYVWTDSGQTVLNTSGGEAVSSATALTVGNIYTCIRTGLPDAFGGATVTALNSDLVSQLQYTADAIYRYSEYMDTCTENAGCSC